MSKKLDDSELKSEGDNVLISKNSSVANEEIKGEEQKNKDNENNQEVGMNDMIDHFNTITSNRTSSPGIKDDATESFIPFSQQTSMTHPPALYEELIQKYEGDIRNHIKIEQQMKLHSDSVLSKLEDKEKEYDKAIRKINELKKEVDKINIELKMIKEENQALKRSLESKIEKSFNCGKRFKR